MTAREARAPPLRHEDTRLFEAKSEITFAGGRVSAPVWTLSAPVAKRPPAPTAEPSGEPLAGAPKAQVHHEERSDGHTTSGRRTVKVVPWLRWLATSTLPLWASTIHLTMERPRPEPPGWARRARSLR